MTRLSFDQTAWDRGHRMMPLAEPVREAIDRELRAQLVALVESGEDVVLDFSFWSRAMRDDWRQLLAPHGIEPEIRYLDTPRDVVLGRLRERKAAHGDDFELDDSTAELYFDQFQPPGVDEGRVIVVTA